MSHQTVLTNQRSSLFFYQSKEILIKHLCVLEENQGCSGTSKKKKKIKNLSGTKAVKIWKPSKKLLKAIMTDIYWALTIYHVFGEYFNHINLYYLANNHVVFIIIIITILLYLKILRNKMFCDLSEIIQ